MCYFIKLFVLFLSLPCISCVIKSTMFNLHTEPLTWNEAYVNCERQGRSLLQINHRAKQLVLQDIITKWKTENSLSETPWMGGFYYTGTDSKVNGYYWSDCTAMFNYTNWVSSLTYDTTGKCVYGTLEDFSWANTLCNLQLPYISQQINADCYFEKRGEHILSEPNLEDFSPATTEVCEMECLHYSQDDQDCQAYSSNGSTCIIMVTPYIQLNSFVPSMRYDVPGMNTFIKRCYNTGIDSNKQNFSPPVPISTTPNTTCVPTKPYPTKPSTGTTEITTNYQNPIASEEITTYTSHITTNKGESTSGSTFIHTTGSSTTTTTANLPRAITTTSSTSTTRQDTTSTNNQDTTSTTNQDTTNTTNQDTTSSTNQDTTSTTNQDTTSTTNQDTASTTNQDTTSTTNQDTTSTTNQDTTSTTTQDTTSTTNQYPTQEPDYVPIQETIPDDNKTIILFVTGSDCFVPDIYEPEDDNQELSGSLKCKCRAISGNSSLRSAQYQYLLLNRLQLSSNRRKLTCAPDERISAISLGAVGITILILTFSVFVFSDLANFFRKKS